MLEQKYKQVDQVREEYPMLVRLFKNAVFTPELIMGLSMALDDFQGRPLIVRSSSLGEDRTGTSFSGKYKSSSSPIRARSGNGWRLCWTLSLRSTPGASVRNRSNTGGIGPCSTSSRRWASFCRKWWGCRSALLSARLRRGRLQQQRVPLVAAHRAEGRSPPLGARSGNARGRSAGRRLSRPGRTQQTRSANRGLRC